MFSKQHVLETLKAVVLATVLGTIGALYLKSRLPEFAAALALPLPQAFAQVLESMRAGLAMILIALALFAVIDVPLQRFLYKNRLKMSHQEVKQEQKDAEGNVEVKAKVRAHARDGQPANDRCGAQGRPRGDEPDPLRRGTEVRRQVDGRTARGGQGR
jgi:flagellar biosynthetic protein FlhB